MDTIVSLPTLDGRFEGMALVNYDSAADKKRGCFSLVFRAVDRDSGQTVALKFFDPQRVMDVYRLNAFHREHEILMGLVGVPRCAQLASGLNKYELTATVAGTGTSFVLPCEYFAVEWIDDPIDQYFLRQEAFSPIEKLVLLDEIARSIGVLHSKGVFHRDLKPDNLRQCIRDGRRIVVPIDLGTAARASSNARQSPYYHSVGAGAYAAPEAHCGLAGNRLLGPYTDLYALGCMLFELFNKDYHFAAVLAKNSHFRVMLTVLGGSVNHATNDRHQQVEWNAALDKMASSCLPAEIDGPGSDVPPGIASILNEVLARLTHCDYRRRPTIGWVRARIESALKALRNERLYQQRLARIRALRARRLQKLRKRQARLVAGSQKQLTLTGPRS